MALFTIEQRGSFTATERFLTRLRHTNVQQVLEKYGQMGVDALSAATPVRTGKTAASWGYTVSKEGNTYTLSWTNSNIENGTPIALIIQTGHGTKNGGYVRGVDYINPALSPVINNIADSVWKELTR